MRRSLCLLCRGTKKLCGLAYCPALVVKRVEARLSPVREEKVEGSSPPSIFVGWRGYPKVSVGPATPPLVGDTAIYEAQEKWLDLTVDEVLEMRLTLIRGVSKLEVKDRSPLIYRLQELAISSRPVEVEVKFSKPVVLKPLLDSRSPPLGPGALMERLNVVGEPKPLRAVEKAYYDTDLPAVDAVVVLYRAGVPISHIQRLFSVGALGVGRRRKLVPTRWSITAVDDTVSKALLREVKENPSVNEVLVFTRKYAKNLFVAIIIPGAWSFEWMEAWFPHTTWNRGNSVEIEGDWEGYKGRSTYASIGGCYYSARLATAEYLYRVRRQGAAVLFREIYEGFDVPIGVWFVRENLRRMFSSEPLRFDSLEEALAYLDGITRLPIALWVSKSRLLKALLSQRKIKEYIEP